MRNTLRMIGIFAIALIVMLAASGGLANSAPPQVQTRQASPAAIPQTPATLRSPTSTNTQGSSQAACPEVMALSPSSAVQGQAITVMISGTNLNRLKAVTFGAGITVNSFTVVNSTMAQASITVAQDGMVGPHALVMEPMVSATPGITAVSCTTREARPRFSVIQKLADQVPTLAAPPASSTSAMPDIVTVTPQSVDRGGSFTISLRVSNFTSRTAIDFGKGIDLVGSLNRTGDLVFSANIKVAPDAALGKYDITVKEGNKSRTATAFLTINDGSQTIKPIPVNDLPRKPLLSSVPLSIDSVTPPYWVLGTTYKIALQGKGFADGMDVDFGQGVTLKSKITVVTDSIAQAEVILADNLSSQFMGERHPKARVVQTAPLLEQPAIITVYPVTKTTSGEWTPPKGKIVLKEPRYGGSGNEFPEYLGAPLLHEGLIFKWEEKQPGLATYFELRILSKDGKTVLKKAIAPYPVYPVSEEFVYEFLMAGSPQGPVSAAASAAQKTATVQNQVNKKQGPQSSGQQPGQQPGQQQGQQQGLTYPPETEYLWEVAGYKVFTTDTGKIKPYSGSVKNLVFSDIAGMAPAKGSWEISGSTKTSSQTNQPAMKIFKSTDNVKAFIDAQKDPSNKNAVQQIAIEVEISERWPLSKPDKPTGLACSAQGVKKGNVNTIAFNPIGEKCVIDPATRKCKIVNGQKVIDQSNYPGDRFRLGGAFSIVKAPYDIESGNDTLYNIVVDWGDPYPSDTPSVVTNLKVKTDSTKHTKYDKEGANFGEVYTKTYTLPDLEHAYSHYGSYHVRVYLLPDDQMQSANPSEVARTYDTGHGSSTTPFEKVSASMMVRSTTSQSSQKSKNEEAGKYAYMIYCNVVDIRQVEDIDATGPLHLEKIAVTDFPGHDPAKAESCKAAASERPQAVVTSTQKPAVQGVRKAPAAAASQIQQTPALNKQLPQLSLNTKPTGLATECDESLMAEGQMSYYGTGYAAIRWKRDDVTVRYEEHFVNPSQSRDNLDRDPAKWPPVIVSTDNTIPNSGNLLASNKSLGSHLVHVEAMVLPKAPPMNLTNILSKALDDPKSAAKMSSYLSGISTQGGGGQKLGYLPPARKAVSGSQPVAYVNDYLKGMAQKAGGVTMGAMAFKPDVFSERTPYKIVAGDPSQLCTLKFPSANGEFFTLSGLQGNYVKNGDRYSGCGTMTVRLNTSVSSGPEEMPIVVKFQDWQAPDSVTVKSGNLDVSPQKPVKVPGASGILERIEGKASGGAAVGNGVEATMSLTLSDTLRLEGVEKPQEFKSVKAPLSASGDWYVEKQALKTTLIGWSAFKIKSDTVAFDFSKKKSPGPVSSACKAGGGNNPAWMGIHLGNATLVPYTFEQTGQGWVLPTVTDWVIEDQGICGTKQTGPFQANLYDGSIKFDSIDVTSQGGIFNGTYKNMVVHIPWLNTDLKGNTTLHWQGGGEKGLMFYLAGDPPVRDYGVVRMQVKNVIFTQEENVGWTSKGDAKFDFFADGKPFDSFAVPGIFFDFAGKAYFSKGTTTTSMPRNGVVTLSKTPLNLANVTLDTKAAAESRLKFTFGTKLHLSKVMPLVDVPVTFAINRQGQNYVGWGPKVAPFTVNLAFPEASPVVNSAINPNWTGSPQGTATAYNGPPDQQIASDVAATESDSWQAGKLYAANDPAFQPNSDLTQSSPYPLYAAGGAADGDQFAGSIDIGMFGGPPIKAAFRLGYKGGDDYWISRVEVPLGASGIGLVPPYVFLYAIRGGLGYNFPITAFSKDILTAVPDMSGNYMFMAGMRVGSSDQFAYMMDGDFSVSTGGYARMDYRAWLLSATQTGQGNFWGFFQYGDGSFDGALQGKIGFLGDLVYMEIPENAATLHFGGDYWHIAAGKKDGPRIRAHLIFKDSDSYFEIGNQGIAFGGSDTFNMNAGIGSLSGYLEMGLMATPAPKITGYAAGGMSANICAFGECIGASIDASVVISAPPPSAKCHACVTIPIPFWNPSACGDFSL